jgi:hypothetical protein
MPTVRRLQRLGLLSEVSSSFTLRDFGLEVHARILRKRVGLFFLPRCEAVILEEALLMVYFLHESPG